MASLCKSCNHTFHGLASMPQPGIFVQSQAPRSFVVHLNCKQVTPISKLDCWKDKFWRSFVLTADGRSPTITTSLGMPPGKYLDIGQHIGTKWQTGRLSRNRQVVARVSRGRGSRSPPGRRTGERDWWNGGAGHGRQGGERSWNGGGSSDSNRKHSHDYGSSSKDSHLQKRYTYFIDGGGQIFARLIFVDGKYVVLLDVEGEAVACREDRPLLLHWGVFRSDQTAWVLLEQDEVPAGTTFLAGTDDAMRTPWNKNANGSYSLRLEFARDFAPFAINFVLIQPGETEEEEDLWFRSTKDANFCIPVGMGKGKPSPLGVSWMKDGSVNFALYSRAAEGVVLCLYEGQDANPSLEIDLEASLHRTGDTWHISLDDIEEFNRYGYRCKGDASWESGSRFHNRMVLLDPYATNIATPVPGQEDLPTPAAALGLLAREELPFDWEDDFPPSIPMEEMVAYRMSVPQFTRLESSQVTEEFRGTFVGVVEKIDHLVSLGVNAVILQPVAAYDETQGPYYPFSFFAPMPAYGPGGEGQAASSALKFLVKELHKRGIEVILEVVYSHTAEQDDDEPKPISFRGIDNLTYYIIDQFGQQVTPAFGARNAFNCNQPVVQQMILDSLKHWVEAYHVDGFCFWNAGALVTGPHGQQLSRPLLVEAISFEPVLGTAKLIADFTSPITGESQLVQFPHWGRWQELNGRFREEMRRFVRGEPSQLSNLATRLCGSGDVFASGRGPSHGLNYLTGPHGLTLADLVSYTSDAEFSWNCGEEGPSSDYMVVDCRKRQVRNFLVHLYLAQGVPVLTMGDECGMSKDGSMEMNTKPFPWEGLNDPFSEQIRRLVWSLAMFRNRRRVLLQRREFMEPSRLTWHGIFPDQPLWDSPDSNFLAVSVRSAPPLPPVDTTTPKSPAPASPRPPPNGSPMPPPPASPASPPPLPPLSDLYLAMNAHYYPVTVHIPNPPRGYSWHRVLDTNLEEDFTLEGMEILPPPTAEGTGIDFSAPRTYDMQAFSCLLLEARLVPAAQRASSSAPQASEAFTPESFGVKPRL